MAERLFGTDGIRGRAGAGWMSSSAVSALGRAVGEVLSAHGTSARAALVGHDGRRSGPELEAALARGLRAEGYSVTSTGLITTPGLALLGGLREFDLAVMISASHNPAEDNGIKIFTRSGEKLPDAIEDEIEAALRAAPEEIAAGLAAQMDAALEEAYLDYLLASVGEVRLDGMVVALDCANGGGSRIAPRILGRLGAHVFGIACAPDGDNINQNCGSTQPEGLQKAVRIHAADLGIALDGDGDRCILVDEKGAVVDGDGIMTLIATRAMQGGVADPRIVATVMSNRGLHRAMREIGVGVLTVGVGDRRVVEALRSENLWLGGEQSGHIVFGPDNRYIGDGIFTALRVLLAMREAKASLSELTAAFRPFPQVLLNVPVASKPVLEEIDSVAAEVRSLEEELGEDGRVLLRYSGTESLARVMVEGPDAEHIRERAQSLATLIAKEIGA